MQPVIVSTTIDRDPDEVYAFLDVKANHERFNDHLLTDWEYAGPPTGLGAKASAIAKVAGRHGPVEMEVIETTVATTIVERYVSHGDVRLTTGTYRIAPGPGGGAKVTYEYAWQRAPRIERMLSLLVRALMRSALQRSMDRLAEQLSDSKRP
jgi:polyketide cyclase/dehydrase/lipid transport protein